jgi:hypothetical protein
MLTALGRTLARLVGLVMILLGTWLVIINLIEVSYSGWILVWILISGALGAVGGFLYLASFDGPDLFRSRWIRFCGWLGMFVLALFPWSFTFLILPMVLLTSVTLIFKPTLKARPLGVSGSGVRG